MVLPKEGVESESEEEENQIETVRHSEEGLEKRHELDTTLLVHLFGKKGKRELNFEEFTKFMQNLVLIYISHFHYYIALLTYSFK